VKAILFITVIGVGMCFGLQAATTTPPSSTTNTLYQQKLQEAQKAQTTTPTQAQQPAATKAPAPSRTSVKPYTPTAQPQASLAGVYLDPGIVANQNGQWVGSDHLYNLSPNIGIVAEIVKPSNFDVKLILDEIKQRISGIFSKAGISPFALESTTQGQPPLPIFHFIIFVNPIPNGVVACCTGRLFEAVTLDRVHLEPGVTFLAITWEKEDLLVSSAAQAVDQISQSVDYIANSFADRFKYFSTLKLQIEGQQQQ
jgi:hypothetical protein